MRINNKNELNTSWQKVSKWYDKKTGDKGHFFQEKVIIPKSLELLKLVSSHNILDLACGQGVFSRYIPNGCKYTGIDISEDLIQYAKKRNNESNKNFIVSDVSQPLHIKESFFTHCVIILALQNIENANRVILNASKALKDNGKFLIVLNHPSFRIPKHTSWEIDKIQRVQYRRINRYLSSIKIPIDMNPGNKNSDKITWSFHNPLQYYSELLNNNGFKITLIQEWISPKESVGKAAKMENIARNEFPMFMALLCEK